MVDSGKSCDFFASLLSRYVKCMLKRVAVQFSFSQTETCSFRYLLLRVDRTNRIATPAPSSLSSIDLDISGLSMHTKEAVLPVLKDTFSCKMLVDRQRLCPHSSSIFSVHSHDIALCGAAA